MAWMMPNMKMETISNGGVGKALGRAFSGETLFLNHYTTEGKSGIISFASAFPGCIRAFEIAPGNELITQRSAFLASTAGVQMSAYVQKQMSTGLFGGKGFVMQRLSGNGTAFVEFDGYVKEYGLAAGEDMIVSTRYLAAMTETCTMGVQSVKGLKNKFMGGEGLFNTIITGPGHIWLNTMPIAKMASSIARYIPRSD